MRNLQLHDIENPKKKMEGNSKGVGVNFVVQEIKLSHIQDTNANEIDEVDVSDAKGEKVSWSSSTQRFNRFLSLALQYGINSERAKNLYPLIGANIKDTIIGFDLAYDRITTVQNVLNEVKLSDIPAYYIEVDIRNLGGLNAHLGLDHANKVFKEIAGITQEKIKEIGGEMASFRHGGDEFSFVMTFPTSVLTSQELDKKLQKALQDAQNQISEQFQELNSIKHPKHFDNPSKWGTGITFGISKIEKEDSVESVFHRADKEIELLKQQKS